MNNPQAAIELIRKQIVYAEECVANRSMDLDEYRSWNLLTTRILCRAFGEETKEVQLFENVSHGEDVWQSGLHPQEWDAWIADGLGDAIKTLQSLTSILELEIESENDYWFWKMINREVIRVSKLKFEHGHYADAVESAFKEINMRVKTIYRSKKGGEEDGAKLMRKAFSATDPVIVLDSSGTDTAQSIQIGFSDIFAGCMTGIRNPKAHENISLDKSSCIHYLFFASALMNKIDNAIY